MRRLLPALSLLLFPASVLAQSTGQTPATDDSAKVASQRQDRGRLGVEVKELNDELREFFGAPKGRGVLVARVEDGTPAKAAGLQVGDVIQRVNGKDVESAWDVVTAIAGHKKGERIDVDVVRARRDLRLTATLDRDARPAWVEQKAHQFFDRGNPGWHPGFKEMWRAMDDQQDGPATEKRLEALEKRIEALERK
ncbi:MAG: PDZ domain-containing protein [Myxococcales bacterium]